MVIRRLKGDRAECVYTEKPITLEGFLELLSQILIGDDDTRRLQSGHVKGLAGCGADDRILGKSVADLRQWGENMVMVDQISVNFIGDDKDIVFDSNPAKFD